MSAFFIDTSTGQIATLNQLVATGIANGIDPPAPPWHPVRGDRDASTLWYAVMRKRTRGVFIGTLCIRHSDHHASLLQGGWQEVAPEDIDGGDTPISPSPWTSSGALPPPGPPASTNS